MLFLNSAKGTTSETSDLQKKKEEEELNLRSKQNKILELENQLNDLKNENSEATLIKRLVNLYLLLLLVNFYKPLN